MSALHVACILEQETYKPGDQAPEGYLAWHEWAEVQHKAGLRQKQCGRCGLWRYPQQLSATVDRTEVTGLRKRQPFRRTLETPVCNDCNKTPNPSGKGRPLVDVPLTNVLGLAATHPGRSAPHEAGAKGPGALKPSRPEACGE